MSQHIDVLNQQRALPVPLKHIERAAGLFARRLKLPHPSICILLTGPAKIRRINRDYLGHDYVTDVITFNSADIVICPRVAARNAKRFSQPYNKELLLYVAHGLLHLAGFNDKTDADLKEMRAMETRLLRMLA